MHFPVIENLENAVYDAEKIIATICSFHVAHIFDLMRQQEKQQEKKYFSSATFISFY